MKLLFVALIVLLTCVAAPTDDTFKPIVVLELFTSQGCSSCPPADDLLNKIQKNYDQTHVIALSYHVDYWNYIGWKDPFSKKEYSERQRAYGQKFNSSSIYTPQMVVNGMEHFVGSNEGILKSKLNTYSAKKAENNVFISNVKKNDRSISFDYRIDGTTEDKQLRVALTIDDRITSISRGENKNRSLKNSNIVVAEIVIHLDSKTGTGTLNIPQLVIASDTLSLITLIETSDLDIVGGNLLNL